MLVDVFKANKLVCYIYHQPYIVYYHVILVYFGINQLILVATQQL
jgi:hypothetical protein